MNAKIIPAPNVTPDNKDSEPDKKKLEKNNIK